MQGVRFTEDWLIQHQAKMAGHKAVSAAPVRVEADATTVPGAKARDEAKAVVERKQACRTASADGSHDPQLGAGAVAAERVSRGGNRPGSVAGERRLIQRNARPGALGGDVTGGERPAPNLKHKLNRPEEDLQIATAELLDLGLPQGWRWWHTPNQRGTRKFWEQKLLKALGVKPGVQDVTIVGPNPRLVIIELKSDTGGLSKAQREWRDFYRSIGVPWFLARSLEDVIAACVDAGVPLRVRAS